MNDLVTLRHGLIENSIMNRSNLIVTLTMILLVVWVVPAFADDLSKADALFNQAGLALSQQRAAEAVDLYTKALHANPEGSLKYQIYQGRAIAFGLRDNLTNALEDFGRAVELSPPARDAAKLHLMRGALRLKGLCRADLSLADFNKAVELDGANAEAFKVRGVLQLYHFGRYAEAFRDFDKAVTVAGYQSNPSGQDARSETLSARGGARLDLGQYEAAEKDIAEALRIKPLAVTYRHRARLNLALHRYADSKSDCTEALRLDPQHPYIVREILGNIALCEGTLEEAKDNFDQCKKPGRCALMWLAQEKHEVALAELTGAIGQAPCDLADTLAAYGTFAYALGQTEEAREYLQRAMKVSWVPDLHWAVYLIAMKSTDAAAEADALVGMKLGTYPSDIWIAPIVRLARGELSLAEAIKKVGSGSAGVRTQRIGEAYYVAGEIQLQRGNKDEARADFQEAVRNCAPCTPAHVLAATRLRQIESK